MRECENAVISTRGPVNIISIFNLQFLSHFCMDCYATRRAAALPQTTLMVNNTFFLCYLVTEILAKNWKLLTLIMHGKGVPLYTKIYLALYIPLYGSNTACGG